MRRHVLHSTPVYFCRMNRSVAASVELKTERLDIALDFCQAICDSAALTAVQALVLRVSNDFLKRIPCIDLLF